MKKEMLGKISIIAACFMLAMFTSCKKDDDSSNPSTGGGSGGSSSYVAKAFSVSDTKQVKFSQGNLQYQASTGTWRFAENQYDCIGNANSNISSSYSGWIDLFGWGTSGWNNGNTYYQPYNTESEGYSYGPTDGTSYEYNLTGTYANSDWGVYNAISNGGNQTGMWRTLTNDEWYYLFKTRTDASNKYSQATVNNVYGLVILPDNWTMPSGCSFTPYVCNETNFASNTYSESQWSAMESNGAIFLPAAGYRDGTSVDDVGTYGSYWSSSYSSEYGAYFMDFDSDDVGPSYDDYRYNGQSVRLVADY